MPLFKTMAICHWPLDIGIGIGTALGFFLLNDHDYGG
jgi:hypothetical protein